MTGNNSAQGNQGGPYGALRDAGFPVRIREFTGCMYLPVVG